MIPPHLKSLHSGDFVTHTDEPAYVFRVLSFSGSFDPEGDGDWFAYVEFYDDDKRLAGINLKMKLDDCVQRFHSN